MSGQRRRLLSPDHMCDADGVVLKPSRGNCPRSAHFLEKWQHRCWLIPLRPASSHSSSPIMFDFRGERVRGVDFKSSWNLMYNLWWCFAVTQAIFGFICGNSLQTSKLTSTVELMLLREALILDYQPGAKEVRLPPVSVYWLVWLVCLQDYKTSTEMIFTELGWRMGLRPE